MPRFRRRRRSAGYSDDEEANVAFLNENFKDRHEIDKLEAKIGTLNEKRRRLERATALEIDAILDAQLRIKRRGERAHQARAAIDRRLGRYTTDIILFGLLAGTWWLLFFNKIITHLIRLLSG